MLEILIELNLQGRRLFCNLAGPQDQCVPCVLRVAVLHSRFHSSPLLSPLIPRCARFLLSNHSSSFRAFPRAKFAAHNRPCRISIPLLRPLQSPIRSNLLTRQSNFSFTFRQDCRLIKFFRSLASRRTARCTCLGLQSREELYLKLIYMLLIYNIYYLLHMKLVFSYLKIRPRL